MDINEVLNSPGVSEFIATAVGALLTGAAWVARHIYVRLDRRASVEAKTMLLAEDRAKEAGLIESFRVLSSDLERRLERTNRELEETQHRLTETRAELEQERQANAALRARCDALESRVADLERAGG